MAESVQAYVEAVLLADAAGPVTDDDRVESLLLDRLKGPFVDTDAADFEQMRAKLTQRLDNGTRA